MREPIEGDYRVIGEKPPHEPIVKSRPALFWFLAFFVIAVAVRTYLNSEGSLWERSDRGSEAASEQATRTLGGQQSPQDIRVG